MYFAKKKPLLFFTYYARGSV